MGAAPARAILSYNSFLSKTEAVFQQPEPVLIIFFPKLPPTHRNFRIVDEIHFRFAAMYR